MALRASMKRSSACCSRHDGGFPGSCAPVCGQIRPDHASAMLNRIAGVVVHEGFQTATRQARTAVLAEAGLPEATGCVKPAGCRVRYGQPWTGCETLFFAESSSGPGRSSDLDLTNRARAPPARGIGSSWNRARPPALEAAGKGSAGSWLSGDLQRAGRDDGRGRRAPSYAQALNSKSMLLSPKLH
jgi:hypothetical protein